MVDSEAGGLRYRCATRERARLYRNLLQSAEKARVWAESIPAGPAQNDAFGYVATAWGKQSPTAAAQWLGELPGGKARDAAVASFSGNVFQRDPEGALTWSLTIGSRRDREGSLEGLARRWLKSDAAAAQAWLAANPQITAEEKDRILNGGPDSGSFVPY